MNENQEIPDDNNASGNGGVVQSALNIAQQVSSATLHKLPAFWSSMPEAWFLQAENIFQINRMSNDQSKFQHVVAMLPQDVIGCVVDLLRNPPVDNKYQTLKDALISRLTISEERRLEQLLLPSEIGDRKPSSFYRDMEASMGSSNIVNSNLLKKLWMRKLPEAIKIAITASGKEDIRELMVIADDVWEVIQPKQINAVNTSQTSNNLQVEIANAIASLSLVVNNLKKEMSELRENFRTSNDSQRGRSRYRSKSRSRSSTPKRHSNGMCWYHHKFGDKATRCFLPCNYKSKEDNLNN